MKSYSHVIVKDSRGHAAYSDMFVSVCICEMKERMQILYFSKQWLCLFSVMFICFGTNIYHRYLFEHNGHANA